MSFNIDLSIDTGGNEPFVLTTWHYAAPLAQAMRSLLARFDGLQAGYCVPALDHAIAQLRDTPSILLESLTGLLGQFQDHPKAMIRVTP